MGILICLFLFIGVVLVIWTVAVMEKTKQREQAERELSSILSQLRANPTDLDAAIALQMAIRKPHFSKLHNAHSGLAYQAILECLEHNPASVKVKTIVLEVGRWHHARCREDKLETIFDEHAMQNDILVRCQMLPEAVKQEVG